MFMERRRESQELEEEFVVEVKVRFKIFDPDSFEIEEVALQHPDESYSVADEQVGLLSVEVTTRGR